MDHGSSRIRAALTRSYHGIQQPPVLLPLYPYPSGILPVAGMRLLDLMEHRKPQRGARVCDILAEWPPNGMLPRYAPLPSPVGALGVDINWVDACPAANNSISVISVQEYRTNFLYGVRSVTESLMSYPGGTRKVGWADGGEAGPARWFGGGSNSSSEILSSCSNGPIVPVLGSG